MIDRPRPGTNVSSRPRPCENSNARAAVHEFQSVFGVFGHYGLGRAKKFAPDAPFSDNFRVFTQSGPTAAVPLVDSNAGPCPIAVFQDEAEDDGCKKWAD